jgi:hypothetical protein
VVDTSACPAKIVSSCTRATPTVPASSSLRSVQRLPATHHRPRDLVLLGSCSPLAVRPCPAFPEGPTSSHHLLTPTPSAPLNIRIELRCFRFVRSNCTCSLFKKLSALPIQTSTSTAVV